MKQPNDAHKHADGWPSARWGLDLPDDPAKDLPRGAQVRRSRLTTR